MAPVIGARLETQSISNSVRYFDASALIFFIRSPICVLSSLGGGDVRLSNGSPISSKNSSSPASAAMHSMRTGPPDAFLNTCGASAGMFTVDPARAVAVLVSEGHLELAFEEREHLLEIMPMRRRPAAIWHDHVDQAVSSGRLNAGHEDAVSVADHSDMADLGTVRIGDCQLAGRIVGAGLRRSRHRSLAVSSGMRILAVRIMACVS